MKKPAINIDRLSCTIGGNEILSSLSMKVHEGEYISVIGPNGAGKTTLLKCLMRILPFSGGGVEINGTSLDTYKQKRLAREIGYVPQSDGRSSPFRVEEFVLMGRYPYLNPFTSVTAGDRKIVASALEMTNIEKLAERRYNTLSSGEKQMVLIASVLAQGSNIILLDEPATFLDPKHTEEVHRILDRINREMHITILAVTHDINSAMMTADSIVILKEGRIVFFGASASIMESGILEEVFEKTFTYTVHPVTGVKIIAPDVI